ncbi:EamA-like transporter family protein [Mesocricetibacter intestinalis]|uniref:EamA-like transporter family protein n=1 Tax=Mesocricetibacter intestinalis TaxID=1521930 RepID=A0A4R6VAZ0_9PAST|nr:EamA-like transporter family protein [Mesocricetibacter intestinalis]
MHNLSPQRAAFGLIVGCILFGLGGVIVIYLPMGAYAVAFWRLLLASIMFFILAKGFGQRFPRKASARSYALLSGVFLAFDLALWHESIYAIGPGISTLLNSLQIFWLTFIGLFWFRERHSKLQWCGLCLAVIGVILIGHNGQKCW